MLFVFDDLLTTLKEAAMNDACLREKNVHDLFRGNYYEILKSDNSISVFCDRFKPNLFAIIFERVEDSEEYCISLIVTPEPSKYIYVRR